jgi:flagellar protein FlaI
VTEGKEPEINVLYKWDAKSDTVKPASTSKRIIEEIGMYTGYSEDQIEDDLKEKETVLKWMFDKQIRDVESVGRVVSEYYRDKTRVMDIVKKGGTYVDVQS